MMSEPKQIETKDEKIKRLESEKSLLQKKFTLLTYFVELRCFDLQKLAVDLDKIYAHDEISESYQSTKEASRSANAIGKQLQTLMSFVEEE